MVSIFSPHFFNWTDQLKNSGYEIYWIDVFDSQTYVKKLDFIEQIIGWRYRWDFKGRNYLKKNHKKLYSLISKFNERDFKNVFKEKVEEIRPDVVHSFVMYLGAAPISNIMQSFPQIKWIYSSWGSDLYYYKNLPHFHDDIIQTLPLIDYLFTDCYRDKAIAENLGFSGKFLGCFPGGGGYNLELYKETEKEKIILVKGYEGLHGRCLNVLKAINTESELLNKNSWKVIVFGVDANVKKQILNLEFDFSIELHLKISHDEVIELMSKSKIYIGNSKSDGIPNTLLEAIITENFPIQSNPGGATAEIIEHGENGLLINNSEDLNEIAETIKNAISKESFLESAVDYNRKYIKPKLERRLVSEEVNACYNLVENDIK